MGLQAVYNDWISIRVTYYIIFQKNKKSIHDLFNVGGVGGQIMKFNMGVDGQLWENLEGDWVENDRIEAKMEVVHETWFK